MEKGRPDTIDSGYVDVGRGRRMDRLSKTYRLAPSRCQESSWSRSIGGANDGHNAQILGCEGTEVARTAGSGGEGGDASDVNRYPQRKGCKKSRSAC